MSRARRWIRGVGEGLAWPVRRIARARLRTKLALALTVAALLPMLVVASLASGVVLGSLDRGLQSDVQRQPDVGLNLTLRADNDGVGGPRGEDGGGHLRIQGVL